MARVFFLGAGFSKLAGFPLGSELLAFVRQKLSSSVDYFDKNVYFPILEQVIEVYNSSNRGFSTSNLELLLTSFTLSLTYNDNDFINKFRPIYEKFISKRAKSYFFPHHIIGRITFGIRNAFLNHHSKISDYTKSPPIGDKNIAVVYNKFFDMLRKDDIIVTLNYDILCEQGLWIRDKWTLLDGYGFEKSKESLMGTDKVHLYTKPDTSIVKIYKLHGSINWAGDYKQDGIILTDLTGFFKGFNGKNTENDKFDANEASRLILPNYSRSFIEQRAILEIWRKAKKEISKCEELYFIGYSLSDIDSSLQFMLYDAIGANKKLNRNTICVIDNEQKEYLASSVERNARLRFEKFLNNKFSFINKSFKDWILER